MNKLKQSWFKLSLLLMCVMVLWLFIEHVPEPEKIRVGTKGRVVEYSKQDKQYSLILNRVQNITYTNSLNFGATKSAAPSASELSKGIELIYSRPVWIGLQNNTSRMFIAFYSQTDCEIFFSDWQEGYRHGGHSVAIDPVLKTLINSN